MTVGGLATVFSLLILLVILLVLLRWFLAWGPVSRRTGDASGSDPDPTQRDRALASAIGVTIALAESGHPDQVNRVEKAPA